MAHPLTIARVTETGWTAITDDGVRVEIPEGASDARLRPGQRVWALPDTSTVTRVWVGAEGEAGHVAPTEAMK